MDPKVQQACQILGFAQLVSLEEIKIAYRKLAIQHHPDKGGNAETFKQIQEAYEYLLNQIQSHVDSQANHQPVQGKCSDIHLTLQMTLAEFYTGKKCQTIITTDKICPTCRGQGYQTQNPQNTPCTFCLTASGKSAPNPNCNVCLGTGIMITDQNMCQECKGIKVIKSREQLNLNLPPGLNNGEQLTVLNTGNEYPNKNRGIVYLKIQETNPPLPPEYPKYTRKGNDLYLTQKINLTDALGGHQFQLKLLDDRTITVQTTSVIISGQSKRIPGYGMPLRNRPRRRGNLIIKFEVYFPSKLITSPKSELQTILQQPGSTIQSNPPPENLVKIG
jgi:DnaJ family protein A protein 2